MVGTSILEFLSERGNSVGVTSIVPVNDVIVDIIRASKWRIYWHEWRQECLLSPNSRSYMTRVTHETSIKTRGKSTDNIGVDDSRCCRKANKYEGLGIRFWIYFQSWWLWSPNLIYKERPSFQVHRFGENLPETCDFRNFSYRVGATRQSFYSFISVVGCKIVRT